jgi:hypothetical protein
MALFTPQVTISTANTNRDGTGAMTTVFTATGDAVVNSIRVQATGTTTDGMIRVFIYDGSSTCLRLEIPVTDAIPSATVEAFSASILPTGFRVENGHQVRVSTHNAETFNVFIAYTE